MAGTPAGGRKAAKTNKARYGSGLDGKENFYSSIGRKGGRLSRGGGWSLTGDPQKDAITRERARESGRKGGLISTRGVSRQNAIELSVSKALRNT